MTLTRTIYQIQLLHNHSREREWRGILERETMEELNGLK